MKKVLIIGPIGDFGGRELETGFIAKALSIKYDVDICTTGYLTKDSQVYNFNRNQHVFSLKELLFKRYFGIKLLAYASYLKNNKVEQIFNYSNNVLSKKYFDYDNKMKNILKELLVKYDLVFICAQLSSNLISEVINISNKLGKPIIFRTTGTIKKKMLTKSAVLKKVNSFIHHSKNNVQRFENYYFKHNYSIVDQCSFIENELLLIPLKECMIKTFIVLSRLSKEKQIGVVIKAFNHISKKGDRLFIYGEGDQKLNLEVLTANNNNNNNIFFKGYMPQSELHKVFIEGDCLIISSSEEAGPITGIEAMCSGMPIISTKVGAMEQRLKDDCFWYDGTQKGLEQEIEKIKVLSENEIKELSIKLRNKYIENNKISLIEKKYMDIVGSYLMK